jgi:acyl-coenzyme A synthetase/AMP-(fatty) acid ligase
VFENRVLRGTFGPNRDEVTGEWRKLHNEKLNDLCCSPTVVRVLKLRTMRWVACNAYRGGESGVQGFGGEPLGKETTGGVDGRIILRRIFKKWDVGT